MSSVHFSGIGRRLSTGFASTLLYQAIAVANAVLLVPLFIQAWGADGYGRWLALTAAISYIALLDLGGQNYFGNLLAQEYASGNHERFRERFAQGVSLFTAIALCGLVLLAAVVALPGLTFPGYGRALHAPARLILFFMGTNFLVSIPQGVFVTAFRATGRYAQGTMVSNAMRAVLLILSVLLLCSDISAPAYAAFTLAGTLLLTAGIVRYGTRIIPHLHGVRLGWRRALEGRQFLGGALLFWVIATAASLNQQGVILVLSGAGSVTLVALYSTHRTAAGMLGYITNLFMAPMWPEFTFLSARQERERLAQLSLLATRLVVFLSALGAAALWFLLPAVYSLWTGRQLAFDPLLLFLLLLQGTLAAGWMSASWPLMAANRHRRIALWSLVNAAATVVLAVALVGRFGVWGVACSTLAGDLLFGLLVYPVVNARFLGTPWWRAYRSIALPVAAVLPAAGIVHGAMHWSGRGAAGVAAGLVAAAVLAYPVLRVGFGIGNTRRVLQLLRSRNRADGASPEAPSAA